MTLISLYNKHLSLGIVVGLLLALAFSLLAFSEPSQAPPGGNVATPLNVGPLSQDKADPIGGAAWITADSLGTRYTTLFATLGGNVGIGTTNPGLKLTIDGGDIGIPTPGTGLILANIDGPSCQKVTVKVSGELVFTPVNCTTGSSASCLTGYRDSDLDTYTIGGGVTLCIASLPSGWRSSSSATPDCNDNDITRWRLRYRDSDADGYGVSSATCVGDHTGYLDNNTDCYDGNANAMPGQTACFTSNRGDGSFDYDCDGSSSSAFPCTAFYTPEPGGYCNNASACGTGGSQRDNVGFGWACRGDWGTTSCR